MKKLINYFKNIQLKDKETLILDLLFSDISTKESIDLFENIEVEFEKRMKLRKQEAQEIVNIIDEYHF